MSAAMWGKIIGEASKTITSLSANAEKKNSAKAAERAQRQAAEKGINEYRTALEEIQKSLGPWTETGKSALTAQSDLLGLNGPEAQQAAISALRDSPVFKTMMQESQNTVLQNASATGGLRGGNTEAALATLSPKILGALSQQRLSDLSGLAQSGLGAIGSLNSGRLFGAGAISELFGNMGAAKAGQALAYGAANIQLGKELNSQVQSATSGMGSSGGGGGGFMEKFSSFFGGK